MASNPQLQNDHTPQRQRFRPKKQCPPPSFRNNNEEASSTVSSSSITDTNSIFEDMKESLECPICYEVLKAPVYMCNTGHDICGDCRSKLTRDECPTCKSQLTDRRNFRIESLIEQILLKPKLSKSCSNSQFGCEFKGTDDEIKTHSKICSFYPYQCPLGVYFESCSWIGAFVNLDRHFEDVHPENTTIKAGMENVIKEVDFSKDGSKLQLVKFKNTLFLYHMYINSHKKVANWAIQYIGSNIDDEKWTYQFLFSANAIKKSIHVTNNCTLYKIDAKKLFDSGKCVSIPFNILKLLLHDNDCVFKFFLNNVKN